MEAYSNNFRVIRGGIYTNSGANSSNSISARNNHEPKNGNSFITSRMALYIK